MTALRRAAAVLVSLGLAMATPVAAQESPAAPDTGFLVAAVSETGYVSLAVFAQPPGSSVAFSEPLPNRTQPLLSLTTDAQGFAGVVRAARWRCDRPVRRFAVVLTTPDGATRTAATDIRTPSCRTRVTLRAPLRVARGELAYIGIVDSWGLGDRRVRLCVSGAGLRRACRLVRLSRRGAGVVRRVRPSREGQVRISVALDGHAVRGTVAAGQATPLPVTTGPVVLTTGDSTIDGIDGPLAEALGSTARVRAESAPGTRLSSDGEADWRRRAAGQVRRLRPQVTVMSLGANEGFPVTAPAGATVVCCGPGWVTGLAGRQRQLMRAYRKDGRGELVWLLLPVPSRPAKAEVVAAANRAVVEAAKGLSYVHVLDLGAIFTPDGQFHETIRRRGRDVRVRAPDGVHLSAAGQAIAADAVRALITRDGLLD